MSKGKGIKCVGAHILRIQMLESSPRIFLSDQFLPPGFSEEELATVA